MPSTSRCSSPIWTRVRERPCENDPASSSRTPPADLKPSLLSSWATSAATRRTMIGNKRRDTKPELEIRRRLHALGLRYRVDFRLDATSRTRADIVFTRRRVAVFVDGCFWHGCPLHAVMPKSNVDYWGPKLQRNQERDQATNSHLRETGWLVLRFWEHENPDDVAGVIFTAWTAKDPASRTAPVELHQRT
ncbi:very short patch repair endonuclease [Pseudoclavibacter sp. Z016]|uniref:very short patch repair endonuclease n=1 Tax=Pseudoclavibacter sp. Z016 TaxID=2080581 RepID=UPI000CE7A1BC|nr:very short patch repair endonuclease [Pseudoclavibacter sp. Z016]PPF75630.1 very short patch repair endonuclease [Pseudoclavibacter sp. Z016]